MNLGARIVSVVFHPLLLATYWFGLLALILPSGLEPFKEGNHLSFVFLIFIITFFIPLLSVGLFRTLNVITSYTMEVRKERHVPFIFLAFLYLLITYLFHTQYHIDFHDNVLRFMIIINALVVAATVVTFFYKISVHSIGAGGLVGMLGALNMVQEDGSLLMPMLVAVVVAGMVMSARLQLGAHTLWEVFFGGLLGLIIGSGGIFLL